MLDFCLWFPLRPFLVSVHSLIRLLIVLHFALIFLFSSCCAGEHETIKSMSKTTKTHENN